MKKNIGPDPDTLFPFEGSEHMVNYKRLAFLKNIVSHPNIDIGEFTYYDDPASAEKFVDNVLYLYPFSKERLIIGRFCAIATGARFIMGGANHKMDGFSAFPFPIFGNGWEEGFDYASMPSKGDTVIGNDVWIGYDATIMPGVTIGDGAIIGAKAVVAKNVEPYEVVAGNPARVIRKRFPQETVDVLLEIKWWEWPQEKISRNILTIMDGDLGALKKKNEED
jgi:virginiamycin A acetyltransferase